LGLDSKDLLDIILNVNEDCFLIPAHIWTPWFSVLGSKSGFDTIDECFEDLSRYIFAIETGLSSDPPMNWICSFLDRFAITSNSDAHSPENLGREANIFNTELSYHAIKKALMDNNGESFLGTIEFFPQEGKYHFDGHRKCGICFDPVESLKNNNICPVCGKKLTLGVMYRVAELADRDDINTHPNRRDFNSLIRLKNILSEIYNTSPSSKKINNIYLNLLKKYGSEFNILLNIPADDFKKENPLLAEAIMRMRNNRVYIKEGYDGEYGVIKVFKDEEDKIINKNNLFNLGSPVNNEDKKNPSEIKCEIDIKEFKQLKKQEIMHENYTEQKINTEKQSLLNKMQEKAVKNIYGPSLIIAGPGTGKTRTLVFKIIKLLNNSINPENILALTFSSNAAKEIKERIKQNISNNDIIEKLTISTFHSLGLSIIEKHLDIVGRKNNYNIIEDNIKEAILKNILNIKHNEIKKTIKAFSNIKQNLTESKNIDDESLKNIFIEYNKTLINHNLMDFDDLLYLTVYILKKNNNILQDYRNKYQFINIDEYQDINYSQYTLIRMLAYDPKSNITVIGDPNQAIYGFRGADSGFINNFKNDYPDCRIFTLDKSYRCTDNILNASSQVIISKDKFLKGIGPGIKINIKEFPTMKSEAEFTAREIEKMIGGLRFFSMDSGITEGAGKDEGVELSDFAVLCRTSHQMDYFEKAFNDHAIFYQRIGESPFYTKPPVSDLLDILKLIINPDNIILKKSLKNYIIKDEIILNYKNKIYNDNFLNLMEELIALFFKDDIDKNKNNFEKILEIAKDYDNIHDFLKFISIGNSADLIKKSTNSVKLMTMHSAKGLEFECVFVAGLNDKYMPFSLYKDYKVDADEERRLLYVAMTRAKKYLYLTYSYKIELFGKIIQSNISPFLLKIKNELYEFEKQKINKKKKKDDDQLSLF